MGSISELARDSDALSQVIAVSIVDLRVGVMIHQQFQLRGPIGPQLEHHQVTDGENHLKIKAGLNPSLMTTTLIK